MINFEINMILWDQNAVGQQQLLLHNSIISYILEFNYVAK